MLNIPPLGADAKGTSRFTGVRRVVAHLAGGLAEVAAVSKGDLEVWFHATRGLWQARRYFQAHLSGSHTHFAADSAALSISRLISPLDRFIRETVQDRRWFMRIGRRTARVLENGCETWFEGWSAQRLLAEIDIYHTGFLPIPRSVRRKPHIRRFTTVHDLLPITNPEFFGKETIELLQRLVGELTPEDYVTCVSQATRRALLEHSRCDPKKVFVIPLAAAPAFHPVGDPEKLAAVRTKLRIPRGPYFLSLCTLEPRKNLDVVIHSFARLRRERRIARDVSLVLVGNIGQKTERIISALEAAADCRDSIILTGFVPDADLAPLYSGALAFVYLSLLEGFGLPPLEAMACGVPVVVSNTSSLPEVVGDAGIQLGPTDLDGICRSLQLLHDDRAYWDRLATLGLIRAREFSWERFIKSTLAAYSVALQKPPRSSHVGKRNEDEGALL